LGWVVNTLDFTDYLANAPSGASVVKNTTWSIWSGDPLKPTSTLLAMGTVPRGNESIALNANGSYTFTITGLNVVLSAGTQYYLGTTNSVSQDAGTVQATSSFRASASILPGQIANWEQSNGSINTTLKTFDTTGAFNTSVATSDTVFDIIGTVTPEPSTWALMGIAIAGFYLIRRRRIA
jgi:hypothetical protein